MSYDDNNHNAMTGDQAIEHIRQAVRTADSILDAIAQVPIADTQAARTTVTAQRLAILERAFDQIRDAVQ